MLMADSPQFVVVYLAAMRMGAIPVPVSTMLHADGVAELLQDSRARFLAVTREFAATAVAAAARRAGAGRRPGRPGRSPARRSRCTCWARWPPRRPPRPVYPTTADSPAFWLYTSGTTGRAEGRHAPARRRSRWCARPTAPRCSGIRRDDRCLSAAKAFFAYGLGNSVLFPLSVGAPRPCSSRARPGPDVIADAAQKYGATLFFAGPTFFANMLRAELPADAMAGVRLAASAGEALPAALYTRWTSHFGVGHPGRHRDDGDAAYLPVQPARARSARARTGVAVPGYDLRLLDENGHEVEPGTPGTLFVRGASAATGYWSRYDTSRQVFQGEWLRTGDTYVRDADGYYTCLGRTGDMLKASGIWVSPGRGRGPAARARGRGPGGRGGGPGRPTGWRSRSRS